MPSLLLCSSWLVASGLCLCAGTLPALLACPRYRLVSLYVRLSAPPISLPGLLLTVAGHSPLAISPSLCERRALCCATATSWPRSPACRTSSSCRVRWLLLPALVVLAWPASRALRCALAHPPALLPPLCLACIACSSLLPVRTPCRFQPAQSVTEHHPRSPSCAGAAQRPTCTCRTCRSRTFSRRSSR